MSVQRCPAQTVCKYWIASGVMNGEEPAKVKAPAGGRDLLAGFGASACSFVVWTGSLAGSVVWWGGDRCRLSTPGVICGASSCDGSDGSRGGGDGS